MTPPYIGVCESAHINDNLQQQYWSRDTQWPIDHRRVRDEFAVGHADKL